MKITRKKVVVPLFPEIYAKSNGICTEIHCHQTGNAAEKLAEFFGLDKDIAYCSGCSHDIAKAHPEFIKRFSSKVFDPPFRHEISSIFFLSCFPDEYFEPMLEAIIAHHKSIEGNADKRGFVELCNAYFDNFNLEFHLGDWDVWSEKAFLMLENLGLDIRRITKEEAIENYHRAYKYVTTPNYGISKYRGLLMAADHLVSALNESAEKYLEKRNRLLDISFYDRKSYLYPLSMKPVDDKRRHTLCVSPTGSGKTDFFIRRTMGRRTNYILPFQSSINSIYMRLKSELIDKNPDLSISIAHGSSKIVKADSSYEERMVNDKVMSDLRVMTPHQLGGLAFGLKGYEFLYLDVRGTEAVFDEIHAYDGITMKFILSILKILKSMNCNIHIGTATMPTCFIKEIKKILDEENIYEVRLTKEELKTYNRIRIIKIKEQDILSKINYHLFKDEKVLIVHNTMKRAQNTYDMLRNLYPGVKIMMLQSEMKRGERIELEKKLIEEFNVSKERCIVVSTQVVEVAIDISFDAGISDAAPINNLKQRAGRINRIRNEYIVNNNIVKNFYIIEPSPIPELNLPYDIDIVKKSFDTLIDGEILKEENMQEMIDSIYPSLDTSDLSDFSIFDDKTGEFTLQKLVNSPKSKIMEILEIDSAITILQSDVNEYTEAVNQRKIKDQVYLEIPCKISFVRKGNFAQLDSGNKPFIIPDNLYETGKGIIKNKK